MWWSFPLAGSLATNHCTPLQLTFLSPYPSLRSISQFIVRVFRLCCHYIASCPAAKCTSKIAKIRCQKVRLVAMFLRRMMSGQIARSKATSLPSSSNIVSRRVPLSCSALGAKSEAEASRLSPVGIFRVRGSHWVSPVHAKHLSS
jgi:hypothetical protein